MKRLINFFLLTSLILSMPGTSAAEFKKTKIAVLDFKLQGEGFETEDMGAIVAEWFITAFVKEGRFDVVERGLLNKIMEEQKLGLTGIMDETTATQIGKILGVQAIISGSVLKLENVLEINARIIDVESASIRAAESVKSSKVQNLQDLVVQMSEKIIKNFPLQGYIVNKIDDQVSIDLGSSAGVKAGMEFIAYKEGKIIKHPKTGEVLDVERIETGKLYVTRVRDKIAEAKITAEEEPGAVKYGQMVYSVVEPPEAQSSGTEPYKKPVGSRLYVTTVPKNAKIRFLNITSPYQPGMLLDTGRYHIEVSAPGYVKNDQWISTESEGDKRVTVYLHPETVQPKTTQPVAKPEFGLSDEIQGYIEMLQSPDMAQKIKAAKIVVRRYPTQPDLVAVANTELLNGYSKITNDKHYIDAMSWLTNVLGASKDSEYRSTLEQVRQGGGHRKLKEYAAKNLKLLQ